MDDRRFGAEISEIPDEVRIRLSGDLNARADESLAEAYARRDGRSVRALGLTEHYQEIFRITRLSDFMEIVEGDAA